MWRSSASQAVAAFLAFFISVSIPSPAAAVSFTDGAYHVYAGENIPDALQAAARNPTNKIVRVHEGVYRPDTRRQALIWLNRAHDGIHLEAVGRVTLTAANPQLSAPGSPGYPAVVNHVVYFGDGVSSNTVFRGFHVTGANNFATKNSVRQIEPSTFVAKNLFFLTDGGGVKIFGRSYPTLQNLEVTDNYSSPCGAGISVQHQGHNGQSVLIENCIFLRNRTQVTGAAIDLLEGSAARISNCLFATNASNTGPDIIANYWGEKPFTNSGVVTVFKNSRAVIENCTFTANRNGVDDMGHESVYRKCIFYKNDLDDGSNPAGRYNLDLPRGALVVHCLFNGASLDPTHSISSTNNLPNAPPPQFDGNFVPAAPEYKNTGYRPAKQ